ncbi:antiterminator LoaP [Paenibacillus illinoisensis]|uniref:antiterminator LoaP n=1 Tax=Paenibacillus illinoisensis TaxID=59845 RepID=UPI00301A21BC
MGWYALFVKNGSEEMVENQIKRKFDNTILTILVPKRELIERKEGSLRLVYRKMFPGYVLLNTNISVNTYYKLKRISGVLNFLNKVPQKVEKNVSDYVYRNSDKDYFFSIADEEISPILDLLDEQGILKFSHACIENSKVIIRSGPLKGRDGIIKKFDRRKKRAKIIVEFLGVRKEFDVGLDILSHDLSQNYKICFNDVSAH